MHQPPAVPNSTPSKPLWTELSEPVRRLLNSPTRDAVEQIATDPQALAEVRQALPRLRAWATQAASRDAIMAVLGRRFALFPQPDRSDSEWAAWWADYLEALAGQSEPAIEAAMAAYVKLHDSEFFPKPGRILELARATPNTAGRALTNANLAIEYDSNPGNRTSAPGMYTKTDPEAEKRARDDIKRKTAECLANLGAQTKQKTVAVRANHGKTDGTGITPALRAIMEARTA